MVPPPYEYTIHLPRNLLFVQRSFDEIFILTFPLLLNFTIPFERWTYEQVGIINMINNTPYPSSHAMRNPLLHHRQPFLWQVQWSLAPSL